MSLLQRGVAKQRFQPVVHPFAVQAQDVLARGLAHAPQRGDIPRQPAEVVMPANEVIDGGVVVRAGRGRLR